MLGQMLTQPERDGRSARALPHGTHMALPHQ
jgi:hypothetical protein